MSLDIRLPGRSSHLENGHEVYGRVVDWEPLLVCGLPPWSILYRVQTRSVVRPIHGRSAR